MWSGLDEPLPKHFRAFGETWKACHPEWQYEFWDNVRMNAFVRDFYPSYRDIYSSFQYNIQRWDAIRYLILHQVGGMYVDFDAECLKPHDGLFTGQTCCFALEPESHGLRYKKPIVGNALMACVPEHPFMQKLIETVFSYVPKRVRHSHEQRFMEIMTTTGPLAVTAVYETYTEKEQVFLIPAKLVAPYDIKETGLIRQGYESEELDNRLYEAFSVHYYFSGWV